jgi:hypothetical protein
LTNEVVGFVIFTCAKILTMNMKVNLKVKDVRKNLLILENDSEMFSISPADTPLFDIAKIYVKP